MDRRRWRFVIVLGMAAIAASIAYLVRLSPSRPATDAVDADEDAAWAEWDLEPGAHTEREDGPTSTPRPSPRVIATSTDETDAPSPSERDEWRARREEWSQLSDEERAQRRARRGGRIEIVPLGPTPSRLDEDGVRAALREQFPAMRDCFREAGGFRALREARRESGATGRPTVRFDVGPDGAIAEGSLSIDPPMPDAFDGCVRSAFSAARFGDVGGEGAGVELEMGRGRRGRGAASLDGGVPRSRDGSRARSERP